MSLVFKKKEVKDVENKIVEAKARLDVVIGLAETCLQSENFIKYRKGYEQAERMVLDTMIQYDTVETDPMRYAFGMKDLLAKLRYTRSLLKAVKSDAAKA